MKNPLRFLLACVAVAPSLIGNSAYADWQYTRWGMSQQELLDKAPHESRLRQSETEYGFDFSFIGSYIVNSGTFQSLLSFSGDSLLAVRLLPEMNGLPACQNLKAALRATYGKPIKTGFAIDGGNIIPTPFVRWLDTEANNSVTFFGVDGCSILYRPIAPPKGRANGL